MSDAAATPDIGPLRRLSREIVAGIAASVTVLATALASGVLAYAPFGREFSGHGATAGLVGAVVGGLVTALAARSSFIVSTPRAGTALVQAGLASALLAYQPFAASPTLDVLAMSVCVLLAGVWQLALGLLQLARIIRFTPHPVLAGFLNGLALLIAIGAASVLVRSAATGYAIACTLAFAVAVTALIMFLEQKKIRFPPPLVGLLLGTAAFHALRQLAPGLPLGPTTGHLSFDITAVLRTAVDGGAIAALGDQAPRILLTSLVLAVVASLDSLLSARMAHLNLQSQPPDRRRFLTAQGLGNAAAAALGGIALSASPSPTVIAYRAGGRTRLVGVCAALCLAVAALSVPDLFGAIPQAVLCAVLLTNSLRVLDPWSVALLRDAVSRRTGKRRGVTWKNLAVIGAVTAVTATMSVTAGVLVGITMSCLIFIIDMSRPLVNQRMRGDTTFSHRVRPGRDAEILRLSGTRRVILDLQGVMFFGNTDDLCTEIDDLFKEVDMILLDFQRVADIDVSAVGALELAMAKARAKRKALLACSIPAPHVDLFDRGAEAGEQATGFPDRDVALEWMEEKALHEAGRSEFEEIPFDRVEFLDGLAPHEIETVRRYLMPMSLPSGTLLCREGEEGDYLWILSSGSVSVLRDYGAGPPGRRVASLARGTIVGELTFLAGGARSATVRADEDVTGYVIDRETFDSLLRAHPEIGVKMLANIGREMARRFRATDRTAGHASA